MKEVSLNLTQTKYMTNIHISLLQGITMAERAENKSHVDNLIETLLEVYCRMDKS